MIGFLLKRSNTIITESLFAGNKVDLGTVIYSEFGNDNIVFLIPSLKTTVLDSIVTIIVASMVALCM